MDFQNVDRILPKKNTDLDPKHLKDEEFVKIFP